jgi:hypothetical protein
MTYTMVVLLAGVPLVLAIVLPYAAALAGRTLAPPLPGGKAIRGKAGGRTQVSARAVAGALVLCGYLAGLGYSDALPVDGGHGVERPGGNSPDFLILQRPSASALALPLKGPR